MSGRVAVTDTPILISLELLGQLELLGLLFDRVLVPAGVRAEFLLGSERLRDASDALIRLEETPFEPCDRYDAAMLDLLRERLDPGESESIAQFGPAEAEVFLTDDAAARREARRNGMPVIGAARLLARLCLAGWIAGGEPKYHELVAALSADGRHIAPAVAREAWRLERDGD